MRTGGKGRRALMTIDRRALTESPNQTPSLLTSFKYRVSDIERHPEQNSEFLVP